MDSIDADRLRFKRVEAIFHDLLALPPERRPAEIEARCAGDGALAAEVRSQLTASDAENARGSAHLAAVHAEQATGSHRILGPYRLERLLGRGGMGAVYLAHRADGQFEQRVAVKVIDLPLATELFRERFKFERQILAGLVHPYITRLLDGGVSESGELYLAMEYVDGVPITRYAREQRLTLRQRLELFIKVCGAVQFAHQNLVVHRDLKPDNIYVVDDGTPRLLDFGTAKLLVTMPADAASGFTQHGLHPFTPQYASPEQVLGEAISTATDTYSLGVLLFGLLTGAPPYLMTEFTTTEMVRIICTEEPPRPGSVQRTADCAAFRIDADLDAITLKALRKEPALRYLTVDQFASDIEAWLKGLPVLARRGNWRYRATKFVRRNKISLVAVGLVTASIIAGVVGVVWQSHAANLQRQRAEARSQDLRELSNSLLSEIDEAIKELPGSTPVQKLLVARVLDHLDRMSKDSSADDLTQNDLVEAYNRLGNLQGNPYEQNIGDTAGALRSLDKAVQIGRVLSQKSPNNPTYINALAAAEQSRGEVLFGMGKTEEAIAIMQSAVAAYESRLALPGATARDFAEAASAVGALGDIHGQAGVASLGDQAGALDAYQKAMDLSERALVLDPTYVRSRRGVAVDHLKIGNIVFATDPARALEAYRLSLTAWNALPQSEQSAASTRRGIAQTHIKTAAALADGEEYAESIAEYELAAPTLEYQAKADPDDNRVTYDLAVFYNSEALTFMEMLTPAAGATSESQRESAKHAVQLFQRAIAIFQRLVAVNPTNRSWVANLAYERTLIGWLEQSYGLGVEGVQMTTSGIAVLIDGVRQPDATVDVLDMATSARLIVLPKSLRDTAWTVQCADRLVTATHRQRPAYLLLLAQALRADGRIENAAAVAREGLALMPARMPNAPVSRLYRLLDTAQRS